MNPDQDNEPALHVPPEFGAEPTAYPGAMPGAADPAPDDTAAPVAPPPVSASWLPPSVPVQPTASNASGVPGQSAASSIPAPSVADDGDVIEKEWVMKAKEIVDRTLHDPYQQTKELHKFKAEYMQKRYNKTIKAVEE